MSMRASYRGGRHPNQSPVKQAASKRRRSGAIVRAAAESLEVRRLLATITVTTAADALVPADGSVSLREAITAINAGNDLGDPDITAQNPGTFGTNDTINFNIPGTGVQTIFVGTFASASGIPLPTIAKPLSLNGYSQSGATPNTLAIGDNANILIQLDGSAAGPNSDGISISGGKTSVQGLAIVNFRGDSTTGGNGIHLLPGAGNTSNVIAGNFIGLAANGALAKPNADNGILVESAGNFIGDVNVASRNVISGNGTNPEIPNTNFGAGISIIGADASANLIQGNYIGLDASGSIGVGNALQGILIDDGNNNTVGGLIAGAANVISGNVTGIEISGATGLGQMNLVQGNRIGTNPTGTAAVPNSQFGVFLESSNNVVGGRETSAGNLMSGNLAGGIADFGEGGNLIAANFIGTDLTGASPLPNGLVGVLILGTSNDFIGEDPFLKYGAPNVIAFNNGAGIAIDGGGKNNMILFNSIHDNALLGIDLGGDGPNPIDAVQPDVGPNELLNHPVITSVVSGPSGTTIVGTVSGPVSTPLIVQFFTNAAPDPSGFGEGQTVYTTTIMGTDAAGHGTFVYTSPVPIPLGQWVTANESTGDTSEFSNAVQVTSPPDKPLALAGVSPVSTVEGAAFSGQLAHFSDPDSQALASDYSATIDWGDSNTTTGTVTADSGGGFDVSGSHTYTDEGNDPIKITINDTAGRADAGGSNLIANTSATVADAPLNASGKTISGHEGRLFSGVVATFTDSNTSAPAGDFTASVNWGDGHTTGGVVSSLGGGQFSVAASHTYAEESTAAGYTMKVSIHDTGGSNISATSVAKIADSPLDQAAGKSLQVGVNTSFTNLTLGTFRDQNSLNSNPADYVGTIAWGDGSATSSAKFVFTGATFNVGSFWKVQGSHKYKVKKTYTVKITLHDIANPSVSLVITATIKVV